MNKNDATEGNFTGTIFAGDILIKAMVSDNGKNETHLLDIEELTRLITRQQEKDKLTRDRIRGAK